MRQFGQPAALGGVKSSVMAACGRCGRGGPRSHNGWACREGRAYRDRLHCREGRAYRDRLHCREGRAYRDRLHLPGTGCAYRDG